MKRVYSRVCFTVEQPSLIMETCCWSITDYTNGYPPPTSIPDYNLYDPLGEYFTSQVTTGTSIVAVEFDGGVILGSDSRTGNMVENSVVTRITDKLVRVTDRIYCCRAGVSAHAQAVSDLASYHLDLHAMELGEPTLVKTAANCFREIAYNYRDQLVVNFLIAGWDPVEGGQVYSITNGGLLLHQPVALDGSGSTHIYGFVDDRFRLNMSEQESARFVVRALTLAMARDGGSGGVIRTVTIKESGVTRRVFTEDQLEEIYTG